MMTRSEQRSNVLLHLCDVVDIIDLHLDLINIDRRGFQALIDGTKGNKNDIIHVCKALRSFGLKRADDVECLIIDEDCLTNWVCTCGGKKILHYSLSEHSDRGTHLFVPVTKP